MASVPALTFGTWKDDEKNKLDTIHEPLRDEMVKMGLQNDGQADQDPAFNDSFAIIPLNLGSGRGSSPHPAARDLERPTLRTGQKSRWVWAC
ncbi:MAG: hypothetical protein A2X39_08305 [Elusimicrobia bacterium GWC2_56_31]|nr:MAG: hypothetical protein A2X39_08305 [Elusimicrobia bacterium GWC2_56_31]